MRRTASTVFLLAAICLQVQALDPRIALTPPMGWSSWNTFHAEIDEATIREVADALVSSGMREAGYVYVNLDDPWADSRDANGNIQPDPQRFPSGIQALVDYVHSKGLKFGIYTSVTSSTCQNKPGSAGYEIQDAAQYAAWGVDAVKDDFCYGGEIADIQTMHDAIQQTHRPMLFESAAGVRPAAWRWARGLAHFWRTGLDIHPDWPSLCRILDDTALQHPEPFAGPGHWNDPDMMEVGVPGLSESECRVHFGMWSILAAPLIAGNDVRNMPASIQDILINPEVIAVDQDQLGLQGFRLARAGETETWVRKLVDGSFAIGLLNRSGEVLRQSVAWSALVPNAAPYRVRDLWRHEDLEPMSEQFTALVPPHDLVLIRAFFSEPNALSIVSAFALDSVTVRLHFSATVDRASVENIQNYVIGDLSILSAEMDEDSSTVLIRTSVIHPASILNVLLFGAKRPSSEAVCDLSAKLSFPKRLRAGTAMKEKILVLAIPKSTNWGYASFDASLRDVDIAGTTFEESTNGKVWTQVYRFDRVPFFNEPFRIDLPLNFKYLRVTPSNDRLLKRLSVFGARR